MSTFKIGTAVTVKKIFSRKKYIVIFILSLLISTFVTLFSSGGFNLSIGFLSVSFSSGLYTMLAMLNGFFLPIIALVLCADLIGQEIADGIIKLELMQPISRVKLYFSKLMGILLYCIILLLSGTLIAFILGIFTSGIQNPLRLLLSLAMIILSIMTYIACSAFIASLSGNGTLTMFIGIIAFIALVIFSFTSPIGSAISFTSHTGWYKMATASVLPAKNILQTSILFLAYCGLFGAIGQLLFDRRNI